MTNHKDYKRTTDPVPTMNQETAMTQVAKDEYIMLRTGEE